MKGDKKVIEYLNKALKIESKAMSEFFPCFDFVRSEEAV